MTNKEFENVVMGYKGKYSERELKKFINYFVNRKHFSTFTTFNMEGRLRNWFSPARKAKFKEKWGGVSEDNIRLQALKNNVNKVNPLR